MSSATDASPLVEVHGLEVHFPVPRGGGLRRRTGAVRAVDDVDLIVRRGETLGLVGESGCGKSTTGRAILRLHQPTAGSVRYDGVELTELDRPAMRRMRRRMQMVFQDPHGSLDPRMTVSAQLAEALDAHDLAPGSARAPRVAELLDTVGLSAELGQRLPHELSGGQLQRIGIARALSVRPDFIVADEPVSALDVSIQAQIVNLLERLRAEFTLSLLFIAHDLAIVRHTSDRVAVMYLGRIVELADCDTLYSRPLHPYTQALMSAAPVPDPLIELQRERIILRGDVPSPADPPSGCRFRTRCFRYRELDAPEICRTDDPRLVDHLPGQTVACHFPQSER